MNLGILLLSLFLSVPSFLYEIMLEAKSVIKPVLVEFVDRPTIFAAAPLAAALCSSSCSSRTNSTLSLKLGFSSSTASISRSGGRIVNVSSIQHLVGSDYRVAKSKTCPKRVLCFGSFVYADSKLALNYFTRMLADRLAGTGTSLTPYYCISVLFASSATV